jgi:hypothetical protein
VEQVKSCDWFIAALQRTFDLDHDVVLATSSR